jgi:hypothetical protein
VSFQQAANAFLTDEIRKGFVWDDNNYRQLRDDDEVVVTGFEFTFHEGYRYSSYTFEDSSFAVYVYYTLNGKPNSLTLYDHDMSTMGDFLNGLLAHEDNRDLSSL